MISKTYKNNFQQFTELLTNNSIPYCAVAGTLLGAIRDGDFIKHDEDVDIGIPLNYKEKTMKLIENSDWKYYCIWRREIGIVRHGYTKSESKIDLFFLETDDAFTYIYSYLKNPLHGIWDIEWRMKFPKECFKEFKKYKIGDIPIYIPEKYKEILELEYGPDWKTSNPKWSTYAAPAYDKEHREIAIIIPTFLRDKKLPLLIESIKKTYSADWYRLYIADQGCFTLEKEYYYNQLRKEGHFITFLPYNCGLSYCRNYLVNRVIEPFILLLDDDFILDIKTNLSNYINILNTDLKLGVVGGDLTGHQEYNYDLFFDQTNHKIYYIKLNNKIKLPITKTYIQKPIYFNYCDIVLNFAMFKTELFKTIQWDNNLKLAEHTDFYIRLKKETDWKVAHTKTVSAEHQTTGNSNEYVSFRRSINNSLGVKLLYDKYKLSGDADLIILKEEEKK